VLCGFHDATVVVTKEPVPDGFNEKLLKPLDTAPTVFPLSDLETEPEDEEKRKHYTDFIKQLVQMENNRISLNFFIEAPSQTYLTEKERNKLSEYRAWVNELLDALSEEMPATTGQQSSPTAGWVLAPSAEAARRMNGYRLIVNEEMGRVWESLLGKDHFPDLVVATRLHTSAWSFQHELSHSMYKSMLTWYIHAKNAVICDGVSDWLPQMDMELHTLTAAFVPVAASTARPTTLPPKALLAEAAVFVDQPSTRSKEADPEFESLPSSAFPTQARRRTKVDLSPPIKTFGAPTLREEFRTPDLPFRSTPRITSLKDLFAYVENLLAPATAFTDTMEPCEAEDFRAFIEELSIVLGLPRGYKAEKEFDAESKFTRWAANKMGFRPDLYPIVADWFELWWTIIRDKATLDRVRFFLKSLATLRDTRLDMAKRDSVVEGWIKIFTETHLIVDPRGTVQAIDLHEQCRLFCLQFVPEFFDKAFTPMSIGPYFTKRGFETKKRTGGRYTYGLRYRREEEKSHLTPTVHITSTFQQTTTTSASGDTVQHISSKTEINLGML